MFATLTIPMLKRVPPGVWTAVTWLVVTVYPMLLVGQGGAVAWFNRIAAGGSAATSRDWNMVSVAAMFAVAGSALLTRRPLAGIAMLIGRSMHQARDHVKELSAQAAARAVTAERLRIARELHDVVAHTIGIVALQAGAARRVIETQPDRACAALGEIETARRETLSGLRRMLGALRQPEPGSDAEPAPMEPGPGLANVDRLAATTTAAGVRVDVRWSGEQRALPPEIDMSAFRIIQEAVTNVVRHADTTACQMSIDCQESEVSIEVINRGHRHPHADTAGPGLGLVGMRERVDLLHGEFSAEPLPEGGFRVAARLPVPEGVR
ncbi:sensor histidine kinase [Kitasatospora sp. NPDC053057]|uniref:sensor histidine kinase n=1 Tax=Kitasatospora sp. NPDC053057 TaxID=3364062 RepID=UPI0037C87673